MQDLRPLEKIFDKKFKTYGDDKYKEVCNLVRTYTKGDKLVVLIGKPEFRDALHLLRPFIAIRNYKSQIPFPTRIDTVLATIIEITRRPPDIFSVKGATSFKALVELEGFALPMASAVLHFAHPKRFPIVDRNVAAACRYLKRKWGKEFSGLDAPAIQSQSTEDALLKYRAFIKFLNRIVVLQRRHYGRALNYRSVDKALMVLGANRLQRKAAV